MDGWAERCRIRHGQGHPVRCCGNGGGVHQGRSCPGAGQGRAERLWQRWCGSGSGSDGGDRGGRRARVLPQRRRGCQLRCRGVAAIIVLACHLLPAGRPGRQRKGGSRGGQGRGGDARRGRLRASLGQRLGSSGPGWFGRGKGFRRHRRSGDRLGCDRHDRRGSGLGRWGVCHGARCDGWRVRRHPVHWLRRRGGRQTASTVRAVAVSGRLGTLLSRFRCSLGGDGRRPDGCGWRWWRRPVRYWTVGLRCRPVHCGPVWLGSGRPDWRRFRRGRGRRRRRGSAGRIGCWGGCLVR